VIVLLMKTTTISLLTIALLTAVFGSLGASAQVTARYIITVDPQDPRLDRVSAHLPVLGDSLQMNPEYAEKLPDRWAKFITSLTAKDETGKEIKLNYRGAARWKIPSPLPRTIDLTYSVHLDHDKEDWEFGPKEAAYAKKDWFFYTGRTLFIGYPDQKETIVEFKVPEGWSVTTPWEKTPSNAPEMFSAPNFKELTNVGLVLGKYSERTLRIGGSAVTIALGQDLAGSMDLFESMLRPLLPRTADFFAGSPTGKFVILANRDNYTSGGAFIRSVSLVFSEPPSAKETAYIAHILCHEMIHLWIGNAIHPADEDHENWLTEGFTDYLSYQIMADAGLLTRQQVMDQIAEENKKYLAVAGHISMREAGEKKADNYDLVYSGGFMAAFALDAEIKNASKGKNSFQTLLRAMYQQFGVTGNPYTFEDVVQLANQAAGKELSPFFNSYVKRTKIIRLSEYVTTNKNGGGQRLGNVPNPSGKLSGGVHASLAE
jgi:predicted metalloprotease with PDZ domain